MSDLVDLDVEFLAETDAAVKVRDADGREAWLPKSQIEWPGSAKLHEVIEVTVPQWLAEEKDLV